MNILHRLTFPRGSEALEFVRMLREQSATRLEGEIVGIGPVLVYGPRIQAPDAKAELYVSLGALTLAHVLGVEGAGGRGTLLHVATELPADMALLFTAPSMPDESVLGP